MNVSRKLLPPGPEYYKFGFALIDSQFISPKPYSIVAVYAKIELKKCVIHSLYYS